MTRQIFTPEVGFRPTIVHSDYVSVDPLAADAWVDVFNITLADGLVPELVFFWVERASVAGGNPTWQIELLSDSVSLFDTGTLDGSADVAAFGVAHARNDASGHDYRTLRPLFLPSSNVQVRAKRSDYAGGADVFNCHYALVGHSL